MAVPFFGSAETVTPIFTIGDKMELELARKIVECLEVANYLLFHCQGDSWEKETSVELRKKFMELKTELCRDFYVRKALNMKSIQLQHEGYEKSLKFEKDKTCACGKTLKTVEGRGQHEKQCAIALEQ